MADYEHYYIRNEVTLLHQFSMQKHYITDSKLGRLYKSDYTTTLITACFLI